MEKIFEIATNISTPLGLAGFFFACLFFIVYKIITKKVVAKKEEGNINDASDSENRNSRNITHYSLEASHKGQLIKYLFILSLVAMFLGFGGFIFSRIYGQGNDEKIIIQGIVFIDGKEASSVEVKILEIEKLDQTNYFGKFRMSFSSSEKEGFYNLSFKNPKIRDTVIEVKNDSIPKKYYFQSTQIYKPIEKKENLIKNQKNDLPKLASVSIQLSKESYGFKRILVNGKEALTMNESTSLNPRINIETNDRMNQEIVIITNSLDTCRINQVFPHKEPRSYFRIVPKCNNE